MTETRIPGVQKKFDFSPPKPRPFLANLPARIDTYEEGVARFFQWRTGLDYYSSLDQIIDFVIQTQRVRVVDLQTDTGAFALRLAGRKAFSGHIHSFDTNITLLERARQRARHLNLHQTVEFKKSEDARVPVEDEFADAVVSIFDFHRHAAEQFIRETSRILMPNGHVIIAELLESESVRRQWKHKWRNLHLKYFQKNPSEAEGVYLDREEIIRLLFESGFRQVIIQGLRLPASAFIGVFSLITATK